MAAGWWGGDPKPQRSTPQDPTADQKNLAGAVSGAQVPVERPPVLALPKRAQGLPNQPNSRTLYAGTIAASVAPRHSVRQIGKAPVMTAWDYKLCEEVKQLRRQLGISQAQLARLCNASLRSVKRWEAHQGKPLARTRTLLERFRRYVEANGLRAFHQRYLRDEPRYHKPGPADRLAENAFDTRVAADSPSAFVMC
jgi:DNA-binding transcriptional regulator YiaG